MAGIIETHRDMMNLLDPSLVLAALSEIIIKS